jgi:hypothetical protein
MFTDNIDENQILRIKISRFKKTNNQFFRKLANKYDIKDIYDKRLTKTLRKNI